MEKEYQLALSLEEIMVLTKALKTQVDVDKEDINDFKERKVITDELEQIYNERIEASNNLYDRIWDLIWDGI